MDRTWMRVVVVGLLAATPLWADSAADKSAASEKEKPASAKASASAAAPAKEKENSPAGANYAAEIEQLRQMVLEQSRQLEAQRDRMREQQSKLDALTEELRSARSTSAAATAPASAGEGVPGAVAAVAPAQPQGDVGARVEKVEKSLSAAEGKIKGIGPFTFSGDLRLRYEPFFGGGPETCEALGTCPPDRHRQRFRLRFNVNAKLNDEISGGLTIASGNVGDPISTNQTEGDFFTRKPVTIDRAFMTYKPKWFTPFSVTGGKYGYTWYRTELTWDNDLNPEGVSQQVMWNWKNRVISHFGVVAFQTPVLEFNASTSAAAKDAGLFGGQLQTGWKLGNRVKLVADVAFYHYRDADRIAQNFNNGNGFASSGTSTGFGGTFGFGGSSNTNNVFNVVNGTTTTRFFLSRFDILDAILRADFDTGHPRWPVVALFNFAQNTSACGNTDTVLAAFAAANPGAPLPTLTCDPHQRHAYWAEARFGRLSEKNDLQFAYTFMRIERDAVVAAFNFSDLRQPTNVAQHRIEVMHQAYKNITLSFTGLIGRQLITAQSLAPERWLKRLQFDVVYKF